MRGILVAAALAIVSLSLSPSGEAAQRPLWPPRGRPVRVPVSRDTWVSSVRAETQGNLGGANRLKTKAYQEFSIVDIDPAPLRGRVVAGAVLHLHCASKDVQKRLAVSTLASEWVEGTSTGYSAQPGSSCFSEAETGKRPWAYPGSDLTAVMMGEGHTRWATWDAGPPDKDGWQTVAVEPEVVAARIAGISHGFVVFDDTGSEWTRQGENFTFHVFPNRFVHSRESGARTAPYFTIYLGDEDRQPPAAPTDIRAERATLPAGEAIVSWVTPADAGPAGTIGFVVRFARGAAPDWAQAPLVPRYLVPMAKGPGERIEMHLRDLPVEPGETLALHISAVDAAGNAGPAATAQVTLSSTPATIDIGGKPAPKFTEVAPLPKVGGAEVFIIDPLDKVQPLTGEMIPPQTAGYRAANHLWSAKDRLVRLHAARNEFVAFQVILKGAVEGMTPALTLPVGSQLLQFRCVRSKKGPLPDPLVPLRGPVPSPPEGHQYTALLVEAYVPHDAKAGKHTGSLTLAAGGETLPIAIELHVWDFTLPDYLSFIPEMNSYGLPAPPIERGYYRVAHAHRACLNRLPYHQGGRVAYAPRWDGTSLDWTAWDRHFGPYLDGSAFADLPRKGVPLDAFYLPLHENWPGDVFQDYNGSYWADRAFPPSYRETFVGVSRLMAEHFDQKGWHDTFLEFYLNNKNNYKRGGWSRGSSPWLLDEPASFQDFWALRWFATAFHEAVAPVRGKAKLGYRIDISRPQWERDSQEDLADFYVCGGTFRAYRRMILDRQRRNGMVIFEYGSSNAIEAPNVQPAGWCVSAWCLGADGVLPWQTIGGNQSWDQADQLSLFYPGGQAGSQEPFPSIRLKAYRRGQQDVEYLVLLMQHLQAPRWAVGRTVQEQLRLVASARKGPDAGGVEDAGIVTFGQLSPAALWELRTRVGGLLSEARPEPKRRLVDLRTPPRQPTDLASFLPSVRPPSAEAGALKAETGPSVVVQGKPAVSDALIDFEQPDQNSGSVPRDNRLRRAERSNAFLVKFDLRDKLPKGAEVVSAKVSFCVWDPSSKGNSHTCAFRIASSDWDERSVTWRHASKGQAWKGKEGFEIGVDTLEKPDGDVVIPPDQGADTASPPLEYSIDVTSSVKAWTSGAARNCGLAIVTIIDRAVDEGQWTRMQILGSEHPQGQFTPKLTVRYRR